MGIILFNPMARKVPEEWRKKLEELRSYGGDLVVTVGGDGTILGAVAKYPKAAILPIKSSGLCRRCHPLSGNPGILESIVEGKVSPLAYLMLEAETAGKKLTALNEINIRSADPRTALRFSVNGGDRVMGDGVVIATPFGATGYFANISGTVFERGIGISYSNSDVRPQTMIVPEERLIRVKIGRGPAAVYADNRREMIEVKDDGEVVIRKSKRKALIYG